MAVAGAQPPTLVLHQSLFSNPDQSAADPCQPDAGLGNIMGNPIFFPTSGDDV